MNTNLDPDVLLAEADAADSRNGEGAEPEEALDAVVARLATLSSLEYERVRQTEAKAIGVRVGVLDFEVRQAREAQHSDDDGDAVEHLEPWPELVDGTVLDEIRDTFVRHVAADREALDALSLWVLG